ncbi:MATE family efflux transporter [Desulfogranum mediterraneum]|uniref:MATE family efflux transporter n=1 Tax=Desulfogranum mediterraneum TaxID=160661 RepID=UPI0004292B44|nr:MATE family efflux transporter [Desulfogranum mediterraneum]
MKIRNLHIQESLHLLKLTGPIILAQLSQTAMGFVDTIMAGRVSAVDLAAVAVGTSIFFPFFLFMVGLLSAVTPLVAQAHGNDRSEDIPRILQQGMFTGLVCGGVIMVLVWFMGPIFSLMRVSPEVIPLTRAYLFAVSWGLPAGGVFLALRNGGDGLSQPRLSMFAGFFGLLINVIANYVLIYGKLGFPAMGGVGCGWATALSMVAMFGAMVFMLRKNRRVPLPGLFSTISPGLLGSLHLLIRLGLPIGLSLFVECSIFSVIALLVGQFGAKVVASHQIALNFTSLLFMLPYSLSTALTVRVGFTIGKQQARRLLRIVKCGITLACLSSMSTCVFILMAAPAIAAMYTPDSEVQQLAAGLLIFAALFQIPDALQVNFAGILRGCRDTKVPMVLMVVAYWGIGLPLGCSLGLGGWLGMRPGPEGFWIGLICGLTASALLQGRRVYRTFSDVQQLLREQLERA